MEFKEKQGIYLQIADFICEQILLKKWPLAGKIISIRDLAILMEVTPNTAQRAYDFLQQRNIISNRRGIGYFVDEDAKEKIIAFRKDQFVNNELPGLLRNMYFLNISIKEIAAYYETFTRANFNSEEL